MTEQVTHRGEITAIEGHNVTLRLYDSGSETCGTCRLADMCVKADKGGTITVSADSPATLRRGMTVRISVSERSQGIAVIWSLLMPLVIFTVLIMPLSASDLPRWAAVLIAVAGVGIYDLLLWRFGPKLSRSIKWTIMPE